MLAFSHPSLLLLRLSAPLQAAEIEGNVDDGQGAEASQLSRRLRQGRTNGGMKLLASEG